MKEYIPILIVFIFVAGFAVTNIVLSHVVGKRKNTRAKLMPYECGMDPVGSAHQRFSVKFYLIAMLFIIFDVEIVFFYPWAVMFRRLGMFGFVEMLIFVGVLTLGLVYIWRKGALEWT
jgi:NADH-quinone oxidoreductase subunit A